MRLLFVGRWISRVSEEGIYENFKLCSDLRDGEKCIVLSRYAGVNFERLIHEHVPSHRLSKDNTINLLKTLVIGSARRSDDELHSIVGYFLNGRGREPARRAMPITVKYPEPGVLRIYCGTDIMAWCDDVVSKNHFRQG